MPYSTPLLSIVIPAFRRPEVLARTLAQLGAQTMPAASFEVIVCEDGTSTQISDVVAHAREQWQYSLVLLQHEGHRGPGYTQNEGIRAARCELILLLADDIWLQPPALKAHVDRHSANPQPTVAVLGRVEQSPELAGNVFIKHWNPFNFAKLAGREELPYYLFWGCNISFKRSFVMANGLFREHRGRAADGRGSGGAAHEDVELGYRLQHMGLRLLYAEEAWGHHYHMYTLEQAMQRYFERGLNFGEITRFVPDPEILIQNHVLTSDTWREYASVFRRANHLVGLERKFWWHVFRQAVFNVMFNRATNAVLWYPLLRGAERSRLLGLLARDGVYRAFLYSRFMQGVRSAAVQFREAMA